MVQKSKPNMGMRPLSPEGSGTDTLQEGPRCSGQTRHGKTTEHRAEQDMQSDRSFINSNLIFK